MPAVDRRQRTAEPSGRAHPSAPGVADPSKKSGRLSVLAHLTARIYSVFLGCCGHRVGADRAAAYDLTRTSAVLNGPPAGSGGRAGRTGVRQGGLAAQHYISHGFCITGWSCFFLHGTKSNVAFSSSEYLHVFSASSSRRVKRLSLSPHIMAVAQTCSGPVVGIKSSCVYALRLCPALQWRRVPCKSQELSGSLFLVRFQPRHRHPTFEKIVKPAARV